MKCWKCGRDNTDVSFCLYCGASQKRTTPVSEYGKALRKIFDDFGYQKVFSDPRIITSALGDLVPDSEAFINTLEYVYKVDLGKLYKSQISNIGKPEYGFYIRAKKLITEEAGFSESKADQLISYFDEMIGWRSNDIGLNNLITQPQSSLINNSVETLGNTANFNYSSISDVGAVTSPTSETPSMHSYPAPVNPVDSPTPVVAPAVTKKKNKWLLPLIIGGSALIVVLIAFAAIVVILFNQEAKLDLNEFASFNYTGYETEGKATLNFDYNKFLEKHEKTLRFTREGKLLYSDYEPAEAFEKVLNSYVSNGRTVAEKLSNGDKVEFEWRDSLIMALTTYFKVKITETKLTDTVKGLNTAKVVDIFDGVEIKYEGIAPYASATVNEGDNPYCLVFSLDKSSNLQNGDTITLTTRDGSDLKRYLLENYGVIPAAETKTITVSGLSQYIMNDSEIPSYYMSKIFAQADETTKARLSKSITASDQTLVSSTYVGYYFLSNKSSSNNSMNNCIFIIYRNVVHHTQTHNKTKNAADNIFYSVCRLTNLTMNADGVLYTNVSNMEAMTNATIKFKGAGNKSWMYYGYQNMFKLKDSLISQNAEKYNVYGKFEES